MELQWPLILFTLFISWSAGTYATAAASALKTKDDSNQVVALITSFALMVIGGIAVFFHLEHWERIFNGFGHLSSGITQELIAIIVLFVFMVVTFLMLRRANGSLPSWLCVVNIIVAAVLVCVMGHSYMMSARPTWVSIVQVCSLFGNACVLGPATFALLRKGNEDGAFDGMANLIGSAVNAVTTCVFLITMSSSAAMFSQVEYYFDGIHATNEIVDASIYSPLAGDTMVATVLAVIGVLVALIAALVGRKGGEAKTIAAIVLVGAVVGAVALRIVMYATGGSVFMYF